MSVGFLLLLGAFAGTLIGCIGIGGVLVVPAMHYIASIALPQAIAAAMMGYVLTGLVGTIVYARNGSIAWSMAGWLCLGAVPAALAGSWLSNTLPPTALEAAVALLTLFSGLYALLRKTSPTVVVPMKAALLIMVGIVTGVLSAVTGTGGPLILVPLMIWFGVPMLTAIGLSQAVQLPIATVATAGNLAFGSPNVLLGLVLGVGLATGSYCGARLAHYAPRTFVEKFVAGALLMVGVIMLVRIVTRILVG